jgi:hypothetical protein
LEYDVGLYSLRKMLEQKRPVEALVGVGIDALNSASSSNQSKGKVGKDASVLVIPNDITKDVSFDFSVGELRTNTNAPDMVLATGAANAFWLEMSADAVATPGKPSPVSVPRMNPSAVCACGSGKRYRDCHRWLRSDIKRRL